MQRATAWALVGGVFALSVLGIGSKIGASSRETSVRREISEAPFESVFTHIAAVPLHAPENDPIGKPSDLIVTPTSFVVLDLMQANLKVFSHSGDLVRIIGRAGDGPSEFRHPMSGTMLSDSQFAVIDDRRHVLSIWDTSGHPENEWLVMGSKLYDVRHVEGTNRLVLSGFMNADKNPRSTEEHFRVHEFDLLGTHSKSYRLTRFEDHPWAQSFNGVVVTTLGDIVVSGSYNSNRIHHIDRGSGKEWWTEIGAPWYTPLRWPDREPSNVPKVEQIRSWVRQQKLLTKIHAVSDDQFLARFQAYDDEGVRVYHYLLADATGTSLALTGPTDMNILETIGDTSYAVLIDDAGDVSVRKLLLNRADIREGH